MTSYEVVGPLVVAADGAGKRQYRYAGTTLSTDDFPAAELERLAARGLLTKVEGEPAKRPAKG